MSSGAPRAYEIHSNKNKKFSIDLSIQTLYNMRVVKFGGIAQLARVPDWQSGGRRFESDYLHQSIEKPAYTAGFILYIHVFYTISFKTLTALSSSLGYKCE